MPSASLYHHPRRQGKVEAHTRAFACEIVLNKILMHLPGSSDGEFVVRQRTGVSAPCESHSRGCNSGRLGGRGCLNLLKYNNSLAVSLQIAITMAGR